jgi:hypothetical protein
MTTALGGGGTEDGGWFGGSGAGSVATIGEATVSALAAAGTLTAP